MKVSGNPMQEFEIVRAGAELEWRRQDVIFEKWPEKVRAGMA